MQYTHRELAEILYDVNTTLTVLRHATDGTSAGDPVAAMRRLGELADELEQFRAGAADADAKRAAEFLWPQTVGTPPTRRGVR